jgi:hypothetical protein
MGVADHQSLHALRVDRPRHLCDVCVELSNLSLDRDFPAIRA